MTAPATLQDATLAALAGRLDALAGEVVALRARITILEARAVDKASTPRRPRPEDVVLRATFTAQFPDLAPGEPFRFGDLIDDDRVKQLLGMAFGRLATFPPGHGGVVKHKKPHGSTEWSLHPLDEVP